MSRIDKSWLVIGIFCLLLFGVVYLQNKLSVKDQIIANQQATIDGLEENKKRHELKYNNLFEDNQKLKKQVKLVTEDNNQKMEFFNKLKRSGFNIPSRIGKAPDTHMETTASRSFDLEHRKALRRIIDGSYQDKNKKTEKITYDIDDLASWKPAGRLWVTGYTPTPEETDGDPSKTAYGGLSTPGFTIAANPKFWPKGTMLYNPKLGFGVVGDTGSAVNGREHLDFMFADKKLAYAVTGYYDFLIVPSP